MLNTEKDFVDKNLEATFDFINSFQQDCKVSASSGFEVDGTLKIERGFVRLHFASEYDEKLFSTLLIGLNANDSQYRSLSPYSRINKTIEMRENSSCVLYDVEMFYIMDVRWEKDDNYYYRILIPIDKCFWFNVIKTETYKSKNGTRHDVGLCNLQIQNVPIHIYPAFNGNNAYFVAESQTPCTYEDMHRYTEAISLALGVITSTAPFGYSYIIASKDKTFDKDIICGFRRLRETIKVGHRFFTTDLYYLTSNLEKKNVEYALDLLCKDGVPYERFPKVMTLAEFERFVVKIHDNNNLKRAALTILEACTMSLDLQGAMLCTALETLSNVIAEKGERTIIDKDVWKKHIRPRFDVLIQEIRGEGLIDDVQRENIIKKFNSLNNTPNKNKLSFPFDHIRYKLIDREKEAINSRNDFLHGSKPKNGDLLYICLELQKLCTLLLFYIVGFNGYAVNNAVLFGCKNAIDNQEPVLVRPSKRGNSSPAPSA